MPIKNRLVGAGMGAHHATAVASFTTTGLTAAGSSQATALLMNAVDDVQYFSTVGSSTGAIFAPGTGTATNPYQSGDRVFIVNYGANALSVYPATGGKINNGSANAAFTLSANKAGYFVSIDGLSWATVNSL